MASFGSEWNKTTAAFAKKLRESSKLISNSCVQYLEGATQVFLQLANVPIKTFNLQDSIGVQIIRNRQVLTMQMLQQMATKPQYWRPEPGAPTQKVWGRQRLSLMLGRARTVRSTGIVSQLLVAAPYAQMVNEPNGSAGSIANAGYLNELTDEFIRTMTEATKELESQHWKV